MSENLPLTKAEHNRKMHNDEDETTASESVLNELLCDNGEWLSVDGSATAKDAVEGVLYLFPSADKQALCCLADLLTKPKST